MGCKMSCDCQIMDLQEHTIAVDIVCTNMAILERSVVKIYGGGVYRCSIEHGEKEMGYTALCDKPEKEAVFLGKMCLCLCS